MSHIGRYNTIDNNGDEVAYAYSVDKSRDDANVPSLESSLSAYLERTLPQVRQQKNPAQTINRGVAQHGVKRRSISEMK